MVLWWLLSVPCFVVVNGGLVASACAMFYCGPLQCTALYWLLPYQTSETDAWLDQ